MFDVCIIGAGPCGINCAISAKENGLSVALVECGKPFEERDCFVDHGKECLECKPCNVISGFGGCVHYGDSAKLSVYPSGRELYSKLDSDYERILKKACQFWHVDKEEFVFNSIPTDGEAYDIKAFPVRVLKSSEIKSVIEESWNKIKRIGIIYYQCEMIDFFEDGRNFDVRLKNGLLIQCKNIVLAMGRQGIDWLKQNVLKKELEVETPISSMGVRFEMPKEYMIPIGGIHPDFKFRMEYKGYKYKTFCFCGGVHGGRLKFANYGDYTLLDGHILTGIDKDCDYGNFALMRQLIKKGDSGEKANEVKNKVLADYILHFGGKPAYQTYQNFKKCKDLPEDYGVSAKFVKQGAVFKLFNSEITDYCFVAEQVFGVIAKYASCSINEIIKKTTVIGLEIEGLWDKIQTDKYFKVAGKNIYIGGDCGGENQGILQATMGGIRIAEGLVK